MGEAWQAFTSDIPKVSTACNLRAAPPVWCAGRAWCVIIPQTLSMPRNLCRRFSSSRFNRLSGIMIAIAPESWRTPPLTALSFGPLPIPLLLSCQRTLEECFPKSLFLPLYPLPDTRLVDTIFWRIFDIFQNGSSRLLSIPKKRPVSSGFLKLFCKYLKDILSSISPPKHPSSV